jgi:hypothetical protein
MFDGGKNESGLALACPLAVAAKTIKPPDREVI